MRSTHVAAGLTVVLMKELQSEIREERGTPIPAQLPATCLRQLSSLQARLRENMYEVRMRNFILKMC